jgi:Carboxypeptidase regulatory-like domain
MKTWGRGVWGSMFSPATAACFILTAIASPLVGQSTRPPVFQIPDAPPDDGQQSPDQKSPGTISGTVIDQSGAVVVGARVTLTRPGQTAVREIQSGDDGQFSFADVAPGAFQIRITAPSFVTQTSSGVLGSGQFLILPPVKLQLAGVSTEVQVTPSSTEEIAEQQIKAQEKQRVLAIVPNYYVTYVPNAAPLNPRQKFELAWKTMIDPVTFALVGATAGVQQARNDFSGYGQGAEGYGKRFGAAYADDATSTFIGSALLPSLFKQDPRYFYKGTGSTGSRLLYAIAMSVVCKGDNGHWQPQYSAILGGLASGAISNLYYPPNDRGAGLVFENTAIGTAETAVFNVLQEFLLRKLTPHAPKNKASKQPNPAQP